MTPWKEPDPFPVDAVPSTVSGYAVNVARRLHVPAGWSVLAGLGVASVATMGRFAFAPWSAWSEPSVDWFGVVGPPGSGKSPVLAEMGRPLYRIEADWRGEVAVQEADRKSRIEVLEAKRRTAITKAAKSNDLVDREMAAIGLGEIDRELADLRSVPVRRLFTSDATPEALERIQASTDGFVGWIQDEPAIFAEALGRYSDKAAGNVTSLLASWSGSAPHTTDRIGRDVLRIERPLVAVVCGLQGQVFDEAARSRNLTGRGFLDRFLFCADPSQVGRRDLSAPFDVDHDARDRYRSTIGRIHDRAAQVDGAVPDRIGFTPAARDTFVRVRVAYEAARGDSGPLGLIPGFAGKLEAHTIRVAGLLTLIDDPDADHVDDWAIEAARGIVWSAAQTLRRLTVETPRERLVRRLFALIDDWDFDDWGPRSVRGVHYRAREWSGIETRDDLDDLLGELVARGLVEVVDVTTGGRPTEIVNVLGTPTKPTKADSSSPGTPTKPTKGTDRGQS